MAMQQAFAAGGGWKANFEGNPLALSCLQISLVPARTRSPALDVSYLCPCVCDRIFLLEFAKSWWLCSFGDQELYLIRMLLLQNAIQMISANPLWTVVVLELEL
jgi:hypothetical protein